MDTNSENVLKKSNKDGYLWKKVYMLERKSIQLPLQKKSVMPLNKNIGKKKIKSNVLSATNAFSGAEFSKDYRARNLGQWAGLVYSVLLTLCKAFFSLSSQQPTSVSRHYCSYFQTAKLG